MKKLKIMITGDHVETSPKAFGKLLADVSTRLRMLGVSNELVEMDLDVSQIVEVDQRTWRRWEAGDRAAPFLLGRWAKPTIEAVAEEPVVEEPVVEAPPAKKKAAPKKKT